MKVTKLQRNPKLGIKIGLGQDFFLRIGGSVSIEGSGLDVKFLEVTADSRCPIGVVCVWEGRVSCLVEVNYRESLCQIILTAPGLRWWPSEGTFGEYQILYRVEPYPQAGTRISRDEYRLALRINKLL